MSRMWLYTLSVLVLWVVNPELRRLYDWRFGFSQIEIISLLPLLSLLPHAWSLTFGGRWRRLPFLLSLASWLWIGGFIYALLVSILSGNLLSGSYAFISFVFPAGIGLWIAADDAPFLLAYQRVTRLLFALTTLICVYGVIQDAVAPAWDVFWLKSVIAEGSLAYGTPVPFHIRIFSTSNDSGSFAAFLALMLLLALPELSLRRPLLLIQTQVWFVAFALALVRTGWLMFALGAVTYFILAPRRRDCLASLALTAVVITGLSVVLPSVIGNEAIVSSLSSRFATLSDLENDTSRKDRQGVYDGGFDMIKTAPLGQGLGVIGVSTKLSAVGATTDFDSGILGRAIEMGLPGAALYVGAILCLFFAAMKVWAQARALQNEKLQAIGAVAIAVQLALALVQIAHDPPGPTWIVFWLIECLAIRSILPSLKWRLALASA